MYILSVNQPDSEEVFVFNFETEEFNEMLDFIKMLQNKSNVYLEYEILFT